MSVINKFEAMMQGVVEGSFGRVFRSRLQPVELSSKLARAMDGNLQLMQDRRIAPNLYDIYLSPRDYAEFRATEGQVIPMLSAGLIAVARERNYTLNSRPILRFHEDPGMVTGQTRLEAQILDVRALPQDGQQQAADGAGALDETRSISPAEAKELARRTAEAEQVAPAWLTLNRPARGKPMQITKPVIHLGRHLSNDVVVNDKRVSRYHAELRYEHGQFVFYDLGSTNGVGVNGVLTHQPVPLKNNDLISIGSHEFIFQRR